MKTTIHKTDLFVLTAEVTEQRGLHSLTIQSVWPQARTDRSPHTLYQVTLPKEDLLSLAQLITEATK